MVGENTSSPVRAPAAAAAAAAAAVPSYLSTAATTIETLSALFRVWNWKQAEQRLEVFIYFIFYDYFLPEKKFVVSRCVYFFCRRGATHVARVVGGDFTVCRVVAEPLLGARDQTRFALGAFAPRVCVSVCVGVSRVARARHTFCSFSCLTLSHPK